MPTIPGQTTPPGLAIEEHLDPRALLASVVESTSDLVWSVDAEHFALQFFNRALHEYIKNGANVDLRPGMRPEDIYPTGDVPERWRKFYRRALADGPYSIEYETRMAGLVLELHFSLLEQQGAVFGITVFGRDVTARHRADEALKRREAFFDALLEGSADVSGVIDRAGHYRFISAAAQNVVGYSVEEISRDRPFTCSHPDDHARMSAMLERLLGADGHVERQRYRGRRKDGAWRHLEIIGRSLLSDPVIAGVVVNVRDVTEQVALAAQLEHVREEEKARIARELHDRLGQLLTGLKLDLLWIEERLEAQPATKALGSLVERAVAASELADRTIEEVQRLATEIRPAALDKLGLGPALQQEGRRFQGRSGIPCRVEVSGAFAELPPSVSTALYRILEEALTNVARHARASQVQVRLGAEGETVVLTIDDDGIGLDPAEREVPGSLGLAGMRERAALEGGELLLHPRTERGTRVEARLPRSGMRALAW